MSELKHHGIKGQKWGVRNGPPYPLEGGDFRRRKKPKKVRRALIFKGSVKNQVNFDTTIKKGTEIQTLTRDPDRLKDTDMFYAAYRDLDKAAFMANFNNLKDTPVYDENGNPIGTEKRYKLNAVTLAKTDLKVASTRTQEESFKELFTKDRDFYNFCTDTNRLYKYLKDTPWGWILKRDDVGTPGPGTRGETALLKKQKKPNYQFNEKDLHSIYRMFVTSLPNDGTKWEGKTATDVKDKKIADDVLRQRTKFFNALKKQGYSALLDTLDAVDFRDEGYRSPVVIFDMEKIIPSRIYQTTPEEVLAATKKNNAFNQFKELFKD